MAQHAFHSEEHAAVVKRLAEAFSGAGYQFVLVGGYTRSMALGTEPKDLDFATDARPGQTAVLMEVLADRRDDGSGRVVGVGTRYGTVTAYVDGEKVDVSTFRTETYGDGHTPEDVVFVDTFDEDAARRDFTMNAVGYDCVNGTVLDPFGGVADISRGILRAVGDPARRFREDPQRLLRAARFKAKLGFEIEEATMGAMRETAGNLGTVAAERVRDELFELLLTERPSVGLDVLAETGVLGRVLPEIDRMRGMRQPELHHDKDVYWHTLKAVDAVRPELVFRLAALLHDVGKPDTFSVADGIVHFYGHEDAGRELASSILDRLLVPKDLSLPVLHLVGLHMRPHRLTKMWEKQGHARVFAGEFGVSERAVRRMVRDLDLIRSDGVVLVSAEDVLELNRADILASSRNSVQGSMVRWRNICQLVAAAREAAAGTPEQALPLRGGEVVSALGLDPKQDGLLIGRLMASLHEAVESGALEHDDAEGALALVTGLVGTLRG